MTTNKNCIDEALTVLRQFTQDELNEYAAKVLNTAKIDFDHLPSNAAIEQAIEKVNDQLAQSFFHDAMSKARNMQKFNLLKEKIVNNVTDLKQLLIRRYNNLADNLQSAQKSAQNKLYKHFFVDLSAEDTEYFLNRENEETIIDAFDERSVDDEKASRIAKKIKDYFETRNSSMLISDAMQFDEINLNRLFKVSHDSTRIANASRNLAQLAKDLLTRQKYSSEDARNIWIETIKSHINLEETFRYTDAMQDGVLNMKIVDDILSNSFDNITTNKSSSLTKSRIVNDEQAIKQRKHMFYVFKDMRNLVEYNKKFGVSRSLTDLLINDIQMSGKQIGTAELFGTNAYTTYNMLRKTQIKHDKSLKSTYYKTADLYFQTAIGIGKSGEAPRLANFFENARLITTMAKLASLPLLSIVDSAHVAAFAQRWGVNYFSAYANILKHAFNVIKSDERAEIAEMLRLSVDQHFGSIARWGEAATGNELLRNATNEFFKRNLMHAWDTGNKISIMHIISQQLARNSTKSFESMQINLRNQLSKYFTSEEWNLIRSKQKSTDKLLTIDVIDRITDDDLRAYATKNNLDTSLYQLRNDLHRKLHAVFDVAQNNATLSPSDFEKSFLHFGTASDSYAGILLRIITQFKMFTLSYIDRVLMQGYQDASAAGQRVNWGMSLLIGTLPLSALSNALYQYSRGMTTASFADLDASQKEKYLIEMILPNLALMNNFLDTRNQNQSLIANFFNTPSLKLISNALSVPLAATRGDLSASAKHLEKALRATVPIDSAPIINAYMRQILGDELYLDPGQKVLYGNQ